MGQHELQKLMPRHFKILEMFLNGQTRKTVAQAVGMTPEAIGQIYYAPLFQNELARRRALRENESDKEEREYVDKAKKKLREHAEGAVGVHVELMGDEAADPRVRQISADAILDRVFEKGGQTQAPAIVLSAEKVEILQVAMQEAFDKTEVVDLEVSPKT